MVSVAAAPDLTREPSGDQRVFLRGVAWQAFEALLAMRGDAAGPRLAYLNGDVELMSPSIDHEMIKTTLGRLLETYAEVRGIDLNGCGSWTLKSAPRARAAEPDECYILGTERKPTPDLALEVVWTHGGLDKLEIYRGLGVREVWVWRQGQLTVHALVGDAYVVTSTSALFPDLDLALLVSFVDRPSQTQAVREFRARLLAP